MKEFYHEETRLAQRWFTLTDDLFEVRGRDRGRKFDRDFKPSELATTTKNLVAFRLDIMRRCLVLAAVSMFLGLIISSMRFPFASVALWLGLVLAAKFAWLAFRWAREKVEVEVFYSRGGSEAFVIFNDKPGDAGFTKFGRQVKSCITNSEKKEATRSSQTTPGLRPVVSD